MKTLTVRSRLNTMTLIVSLAACGDDPITIAEVIDAVRNDDPSSGDTSEPSPEEVPSEVPRETEPVEASPPVVEPASEEEEEQVIAILLEYCGQCHDGYPEDVPPPHRIADIDQLIADQYIIPGSRLDSPIYVRMFNGSMPPISFEAVPAEDIERVGAFIDSL
jgi:hypothetical protein